MDKTGRIQKFTDLQAWQVGHALVLEIYTATKEFPKEELFGLVSQMRRSAVSITSNIAEGFSRHSRKEKEQFFAVTKGSITELENQLFVARDTNLISSETFEYLYDKSVQTHKLVNALLTKLSQQSQ
jgi:four helix bundle protein